MTGQASGRHTTNHKGRMEEGPGLKQACSTGRGHLITTTNTTTSTTNQLPPRVAATQHCQAKQGQRQGRGQGQQ